MVRFAKISISDIENSLFHLVVVFPFVFFLSVWWVGDVFFFLGLSAISILYTLTCKYSESSHLKDLKMRRFWTFTCITGTTFPTTMWVDSGAKTKPAIAHLPPWRKRKENFIAFIRPCQDQEVELGISDGDNRIGGHKQYGIKCFENNCLFEKIWTFCWKNFSF